MKKNKLPIVGVIQDIEDEFNKQFNDEVFMPMVKTAVTIIFVAVVLDYSFQLTEAIDVILAN